VGCEAYAPSEVVPPVRSHRLGQIFGAKRIFSIFRGQGLTDDWESAPSASMYNN